MLLAAVLAATTLATPVADRVATLAVLDKVSSEVRELQLKPGTVVRHGKLRIALKVCERTPPWEAPLTGAFVQIDRLRGQRAERAFSGWLFAESPSLNSFDDERYDVWVKACAMNFPEITPPPATSPSRPPSSPAAPARASSAPQSAPSADTAGDSN